MWACSSLFSGYPLGRTIVLLFAQLPLYLIISRPSCCTRSWFLPGIFGIWVCRLWHRWRTGHAFLVSHSALRPYCSLMLVVSRLPGRGRHHSTPKRPRKGRGLPRDITILNYLGKRCYLPRHKDPWAGLESPSGPAFLCFYLHRTPSQHFPFWLSPTFSECPLHSLQGLDPFEWE